MKTKKNKLSDLETKLLLEAWNRTDNGFKVGKKVEQLSCKIGLFYEDVQIDLFTNKKNKK